MEFADVQFAAVAGVIVSLVTQLIKKYLPKADPRYIVMGLCALVGLGYSLVVSFVPQDVLTNMAAIGTLAWVTGTGVYKLQK